MNAVQPPGLVALKIILSNNWMAFPMTLGEAKRMIEAWYQGTLPPLLKGDSPMPYAIKTATIEAMHIVPDPVAAAAEIMAAFGINVQIITDSNMGPLAQIRSKSGQG